MMGIDFSRGTASWSYSGFNHFRRRLAEGIGIFLDEMDGFGGDIKWDTINDAIVPFLNHSDCDGSLTALQCCAIAPRLLDMVKDWPDDDYDKINALELVEGMKEAIEDDADIEFC
jgi:hypothetical protein